MYFDNIICNVLEWGRERILKRFGSLETGRKFYFTSSKTLS